MDERESKMELAGGVGAVTTPEEQDVMIRDEPGAATGLALEPGEEPVHGGAAEMEETAQGSEAADGAETAWVRTVAEGEELTRDDAANGVKEPATGADELEQGSEIAGAEKQTSVGYDAGTQEPALVGFETGSDEPDDGAADGGTGTKEAVIEDRGSEAEWKCRAESYALRAVFSEARAAAAAMGVPENRLDQAARLSDLSDIDPEDGKALGRIGDAVRAVLREHPELCGGVGTGQATTPRKARRDAFERGFLGE